MGLRFDVEVSLALGADLTADPGTWSWTDITDYAMLTDGGVTIQRGRPDEQTRVQPSMCTVRLNNADGRFSRLNPVGAYYGQLQKNTPLRIRACEAGGSLVTRFVGYVSEWPPRWTHGQKHKWVQVRANGVLRRLTQGASPIRSPLHRAFSAKADAADYWPLEDEGGRFGSALSDRLALRVSGSIDFAAVTDAPGSAALPQFSTTTRLSGAFGGSFPNDLWFLSWLVKFSTTPASLTTLMDVQVSGSAVSRWVLAVDSTTLYLTGLDDAGATVYSDTTSASLIAANLGTWLGFQLRAITGAQWGFTYFDLSTTSTGPLGGTDAALVAGSLVGFEIPASAELDGLSIGHIGAFNVSQADEILIPNGPEPINAYDGETDVDRFNRVCDQEGIPYITATGEGVLLGPQPVDDAVAVLRDGEAAGQGLLYEALTGELAYQPLRARYNLDVDLALDHDQGHIVPDFEPTDDDLLTRNDVTVTRTNGSSARAADDDSIAAVGRVGGGLTLNLHTDDQVADHANWRLHIGTIDDYRYPTVTLALHKSTSLLTDWLACDIGSRLTIDNMPADVTPDLVDQIIEGYTERISSVAWDVAVNLSPGEPYDIGTYQATPLGALTKRYDTLHSTLTSDVDAGTDTALSVTIATGGSLWTTKSASWVGLQVEAGGAIWDVTSITGSSSPQTINVTATAANGVVKTVPAGTQIRVAPRQRAVRGL